MSNSFTNDVLQFISQFRECKHTFLYGCCYWFAFILKERFNGQIYYNPIENHFATKINGDLYDVSGEITCDSFVLWDEYKKVDELEAARIERDCIKKLGVFV